MEWIRIHTSFERESADVYLTILNVIYIPIFFRITYFLRFFLLNRNKIVGVFRSVELSFGSHSSDFLVSNFIWLWPTTFGHKFYFNFLLVEFQNFWSVQQSLYFVKTSASFTFSYLYVSYLTENILFVLYTLYHVKPGMPRWKRIRGLVRNQFPRFFWTFWLNTFRLSALFSVWSASFMHLLKIV